MINIKIKDINIEVLRKNIKNMNLSVHPPNGRVRLSVPERMDDESIRNFIISKLPWIKRQRSKFSEKVILSELKFMSGEIHYLFGEKYTLIVLETSKRQYVKLKNNKEINLYVIPNSTRDKREKIMIEWYREKLKNLIPQYIEKWEPVLGVEVNDWGVKKMKTRWGSCNIQAKRIWINLEFAKKDERFLEYVLVHEMVHLLERKHNQRFESFMDKFIPNWRDTELELNGFITYNKY